MHLLNKVRAVKFLNEPYSKTLRKRKLYSLNTQAFRSLKRDNQAIFMVETMKFGGICINNI